MLSSRGTSGSTEWSIRIGVIAERSEGESVERWWKSHIESLRPSGAHEASWRRWMLASQSDDMTRLSFSNNDD